MVSGTGARSILESADGDEIALRGGRLTPGVVRVGDTVRRPAQPSSQFVERLLLHLQDANFVGAPHYLGRDELGRDIQSYIPGWVPARFQQFTDAQVIAAAILLGDYHAATRSSSLVSGDAVVCHHDCGPNNFVFQNGRPIALIDFAMAAPGNRLDDLAYLAWTWCVSSKASRGPARRQAQQLRLLADAYGLTVQERHQLCDAMQNRQRRNAQFWDDALQNPVIAARTSAAQMQERIAWSNCELAYTDAQRSLFEAALR